MLSPFRRLLLSLVGHHFSVAPFLRPLRANSCARQPDEACGAQEARFVDSALFASCPEIFRYSIEHFSCAHRKKVSSLWDRNPRSSNGALWRRPRFCLGSPELFCHLL